MGLASDAFQNTIHGNTATEAIGFLVVMAWYHVTSINVGLHTYDAQTRKPKSSCASLPSEQSDHPQVHDSQ